VNTPGLLTGTGELEPGSFQHSDRRVILCRRARDNAPDFSGGKGMVDERAHKLRRVSSPFETPGD
jgi:hypothetical protein